VSTDKAQQSESAAKEVAVAGPWWAGRERQLALLISAQALYLCTLSVDLTLSGLVGYALAPSPDLATLPFGLITVGAACTTGLASALMARRGRRTGFVLGTGFATVGGLLSVTAIVHHSFALFCLGALCVGVYQGCAGYYRYAAADQVAVEFRARAISTVLTGGLAAAIAGPFIATALMNVTSHQYEGSYILVSILSIIAMVVVAFFKDRSVVSSPAAERKAPARKLPFAAIARQPGFAVGVFAASVGYVTMMIVMTVGPIASMQAGMGPDPRSFMIQLHMVGMYAPALAATFLIRKMGILRLQLLGAGAGITGVIIGASGDSEVNFILALALVGVAWSLLYISGSSMIATSYAAKDRARTQAFGEAVIMSSSAIGGLSAASLLTNLGWADLNLMNLALLVSCVVVTVVHQMRRPAASGVVD
jgi:predicted MFS family arabinose efflux permease